MKQFYLFAITICVCMTTSCLVNLAAAAMLVDNVPRIVTAYLMATAAGLASVAFMVPWIDHTPQ